MKRLGLAFSAILALTLTACGGTGAGAGTPSSSDDSTLGDVTNTGTTQAEAVPTSTDGDMTDSLNQQELTRIQAANPGIQSTPITSAQWQQYAQEAQTQDAQDFADCKAAGECSKNMTQAQWNATLSANDRLFLASGGTQGHP